MISSARIALHQGQKIRLRSSVSSSQLMSSLASSMGNIESINYAAERDAFFQRLYKDKSAFDEMVYSLSFSTKNKSSSTRFFSQMPDARMQQQLQLSEKQLFSQTIDAIPKIHWDDAPLPRTREEASKQTYRAIVITEAVKPFRVVDVNQAWEGLCGFSLEESLGKSLGALLKGPETDPLTVTSLVALLLRGEEAGAILTNYTKDKRRFRNRLRVGPLVENSRVTHYVGVLQEIKDGM